MYYVTRCECVVGNDIIIIRVDARSISGATSIGNSYGTLFYCRFLVINILFALRELFSVQWKHCSVTLNYYYYYSDTSVPV